MTSAQIWNRRETFCRNYSEDSLDRGLLALVFLEDWIPNGLPYGNQFRNMT